MNKAIKEIRGQDTAELRGQLKDLRKEQFELRFRGVAEARRNRQIRRTIARIMTVLGDRARTAQTPAAQSGDKQ